MGHSRRRQYTQTEKSEMWDRWQRGESMNEIGRHFGIHGHWNVCVTYHPGPPAPDSPPYAIRARSCFQEELGPAYRGRW